MKKIYKRLLSEQIKRGVIFSSCLSKEQEEQPEDYIYEVLENQENKDEVISKLLNDKIFNKSQWKYNVIRK